MWVLDLIALTLSSIGCVTWTARAFKVAARDALDLAAKLAVPEPRSAADWPELRVDEVVCDPEAPNRVLLVGRWPAHPEPRSLLELEVGAPPRARQLLTRWCDVHASISSRSNGDGRVVLRRRRTNESLEVRITSEVTLGGH